MKSFLLLATLLLAAGTVAQAQTVPPRPAPETLAQIQKDRYAAANDSLLRLVGKLRTEAEGHMGFFKSSKGTFGGLHHRVKTYATSFSGNIDYSGVKTPSGIGLVKRQVVKRRFGVELEKVAYYDAKGRKVLLERYEDHRLTRLETFEYIELLSRPASYWLFVRGNYLKHVTQSSLASVARKTLFYFTPLPTPKPE
ncbi:hypothetical protein Q5H92_21235 [Hymenobacter sp. M29]|uniref:Uncharacterized protein n=1 Tax=Hymenobacter mellowenesis TaxID=3063995 RepID=A0ABT9AGA3_9BACT|nr:hypothetical protein [Hymenobacter sp. M29]MDO7848903.1 hypothetical protein [Hymenobacter sp. M29]